VNALNANNSQQKTHFSFTLSDPDVDGLRRNEFDIEFLLPDDGDVRRTVGDGGGSNIDVVETYERGMGVKRRRLRWTRTERVTVEFNMISHGGCAISITRNRTTTSLEKRG